MAKESELSHPRRSRGILNIVLRMVFTIGIPSVWGQDTTAVITGKISDPTGASVPTAEVTAVDHDRGTIFTTFSNTGGIYDLRVPIGTYSLIVTHQDFKAAHLAIIQASLNQAVRVDIQLELGSRTTVVEVRAVAPLLQADTTQIGIVMQTHFIENLPLETGNYLQLALLTPGATTTSPGAFNTGLATFNTGRPYINGNREQANHYLLDGMDNNEFVDNNVAYSPNVNAIQEFNVVTNNPSAEFGHFLGGVISVSTKSGTNLFHGNVFAFLRNDFFNANEWFRNFNQDPDVNSSPRKLRWNEFGATLGGFIKRNKLFFFTDYQGTRFDMPATVGTFTSFTSQEAKGNLSDVQGTHLHYPGTTVPMPADLTRATMCGPGQTFTTSPCINGLSATALKILNVLPKQDVPEGLSNREHTYTNGDQGDIKVDWYITDTDRMFGRYSQQYIEQPTLNSQPLLYNGDGNNVFPLHSGVINYTKVINPTTLNDFRAGVNYFPVEANVQSLGTANVKDLIPGQPTPFLPGLYFVGTSVGGSQNGPFAFGTSDAPEIRHQTEIQVSDTVTLIRGGHSIHVGFQFERYRDNYIPVTSTDGSAGQIGFTGQFTGNAEADFLLGLPSYMAYGKGFAGTVGQRNSAIGAFFQDDWRVSRHVAVNVGLRWQLFTPIYEVHNRMTNFNEISGKIELAGQGGNSRALYNQYNGIANFLPRLGIAWTTPDNRGVVRAAFSRSSFQEGTGESDRLATNSPWNVSLVSQPIAGLNGAIPANMITLDQGFAAIGTTGIRCSMSSVISAPPACFAGAQIELRDPNYRPAVSNQWSLTLQWQFGNSTTAQAAYIGQHSDHLADSLDANQKFLLSDGTAVPGPYLLGNPTLKNEIGGAILNETTAVQNYEALQLTLQRRWSRGLGYALNYALSKCLTDSMGYYGRFGDQTASQASADKTLQEYAYNLRLDYGLCDHDVTNVFNGYFSYDLPFGQGRMFGHHVNKAVDTILGGWEVNGDITVHGGFPISILDFTDPSRTGSAEPRPDCVRPSRETPYRNYSSGGYIWFDPTTMAHPSPGHLGNCPVSSERGPGLRQLNLGLTKHFSLGDRQSLELRAEAINAFNTPIFTVQAFSTDVFGGRNFGVISTSLGARNLQFGLKYRF